MKTSYYTRKAALVALSFAAAAALPSATADTVPGNEGVDMGQIADGIIYNMLTIPVNSVDGSTWTTAGSGYAQFVAPVSQFTGINNDGSNVPPRDLIPLRSTSYEIVDPNTGVPSYLLWNANNGLIKNWATVQLGGSLVQPTSIDQAGKDLTFGGTGTVNLTGGGTKLFVSGLSAFINSGQRAGYFHGGHADQTVVAILQESSTIGSPYLQFEHNVGGTGVALAAITRSAGGVAYNTTSDERLKENIRPSAKGLQEVMKLQVSDYNYKKNKEITETGFIAQQLHTLLPHVVTVGGEDPAKNPWMVDYSKVTPLLAKAIQELKSEKDAEIAALKAENAEFRKMAAEMKEIKDLVAALEAKASGTVTVSLTK